MKFVRIPIWLGVAFVFSVSLVSPVAAFQVAYNYYCYATGSDGIPIMDNDTLTDEWYVAGDYTKTGAEGNYGTVRFYADLSTATVSAFAHSHGLQTGPYTFPSGTGRVEKIHFEDHLIFTVPAGFYPDGVLVSLLCQAEGTITSDLGAGAKARYYVLLGSSIHEVGVLEVGVDESDTIIVDEVFTVTKGLVAPGTTLNESRDYSETVRAAIRRGWTWSTTYNPGGGNVIGDGEIDFQDGLRILAVQVPPGVSWTSESGIFPNLPSPVPGDPAVARAPQLLGSFPNPFNPMTTIRFDLPEPATVRLNIYDVKGRLVRTLVAAEAVGAGRHEVIWNGRRASGRVAATGVYFCRMEVGEFTETARLTLIR
ncbi:MAG: hypothetical protein DRP71_13730 [Verrucomicrobia bacterium]|nr:MAG: hypothetical protein DRP71_13730 [Verrucomicrobiota bacterium]